MKTKPDLSIDRINEKNSAIAPGLTVVFWCNDSVEVVNTFAIIRKKLFNYKKHIWWYSNEHIHITLSPLIRTKYDRNFYLESSDLPNTMFNIIEYISKVKIFSLKITHYSIKQDGQIQLIGGIKDNVESIYTIRRMNEHLDPTFKYLAHPRVNNLTKTHTNIGYFKSLPKENILAYTEELDEEIIIEVNKVSVVHYLKRTLENRYIASQIHIPLQSKLKISYNGFNQLLKIR